MTGEQRAAMAAATSVETLDGGKGRAIVRDDGLSESDPRFYMDFEWLAWFGETYREWSVVSMSDSHDDNIVWTVQIERRPRG